MKQKEKKHKKKKRQGVVLGLLIFILGILIVLFSFMLLFHTQKIEVKGNKYVSEEDVTEWLKKDKYTANTVYIWGRYNFASPKQLPGVESTKITLRTPWIVQVTVKEKEISGYIEYNGGYLCFDKEGTAMLTTADKPAGVANLEGLEVDVSKVKLGEVLPVSDKDIFQRTVELSKLLRKYKLVPDRIVCSKAGPAFYFGNVEVLVGKTNYEDRVAQLPPILEKLSKQYPDTPGTLHLENYDTSDKIIRFVPDKK
ncbi:cell division protein FtsQ [Muricomes intestini]|uniref:Cell division protein FtsQ n=1 Tax=Muricomes intestini TaxID=1796634 RepID=A0A4R3KDP6_9FIRM|nr:FtsQ-type POTRA domain-containing protein [Muricomes intestini]TCS80771.1 cell division protein FtsQ [Muricomes intestini]